MDLKLPWAQVLSEEYAKEYFINLLRFIELKYQSSVCFPPKSMIFNAFEKCDFDNIKVVILGQDPYHGPGQANGLSFSVNDGVAFPPSLRNIFKEIKNDLNLDIPFSGNLEKWATQGVFLLNATLTVEVGKPGSHQKQGWERFTDEVINTISREKENVVFMLWGGFAHKKENIIDKNKHLILKAAHPSPLSANRGGWFNQKQFSSANTFLTLKGYNSIKW